MPREVTYKGVTVDVIRAEDQGAYLFVVNVEGAQIEFARTKLGGFDKKVAAAAADAEAAKAAKKSKDK